MAFSATRMLMAASGVVVTPPFTVSAAELSGGTHLAIGNSTVADSPTGIFSCWVNFATFDNPNIISNNTNGITFEQNGGVVSLHLSNSGNTSNVIVQTAASYITTGTWYNILASWNTNFAAGSKIFTMYINGVNAVSTTTDTFGAFNCGYNGFPVNMGFAGANGLDGCITQFYFAPGQFLDFTVSGNRAKFYNAGSPVNLGSTGQTPTGTSPAYFWPGVYTSTTNLGSQGSSWAVTGTALSNCATTP